jgi:di/tricarboxylate transporter
MLWPNMNLIIYGPRNMEEKQFLKIYVSVALIVIGIKEVIYAA